MEEIGEVLNMCSVGLSGRRGSKDTGWVVARVPVPVSTVVS